MTEQNTIRAARRKTRRFEHFGTSEPHCFYCGESDIACLEVEHPVGRKRDQKFTRIVCRNCHRKLEMGRDAAGLTTNGMRGQEPRRLTRYRYLLLLAADHEATAASIRRKAEEWNTDDDGEE